MLEEALSSTTYSPAEAALALTSFVQVELPAGGASAEARFFKLFSLLCDRVFGPLSSKDYKHLVGGWLSREIRWERPPSALNSPQRTYRVPTTGTASNSLSADPVVKLLGAASQFSSKEQLPPPTLIEAFAKEAEHRPNVRYPFPFQALPKPTQDAWIALLEAALGGAPVESRPSENSTRLLGSLLRVRPTEQGQLRAYQQKKVQKKELRRPLQLSPGYNTPVSPANASTPTKEKDTPPNIMLSMLEYFLFIFIRYPLADPPPSDKQPSVTSRGVRLPQRRTEHYGDSVYYHLYTEYSRYFIPCNRSQGHYQGFDTLSRPSELFIRISIELWMEGQNQLAPTDKAVKKLQERKSGLDLTSFDLNFSYDLVEGKYDPPPNQVQRCIHRIAVRTVSDGAILDAARDIQSNYGGPSDGWCLTPCTTAMQLPFYNYIRAAFRHASIHAAQSPFFAALNSWLVWLEPWNATHGRSNDATTRILGSIPGHAETKMSPLQMTYPKPTQKSNYNSAWEPYIAANLHLYTVPLALFLRRARELDFSPKEFHRSLKVVQRVFRVYSPAVVDVLNRLLASRQSPSRFSDIVAKHEKNMGVYAPSPSWTLSLTSCKDDMHNLLEEMYVQHLKKVRELDILDRMAARLEGLFGQGVVQGEENELHAIVDRAKIVVGFPRDYEVVPSGRKVSGMDSQAGKCDDAGADRTSEGFLSDSGRQRLLEGTDKCSQSEILDLGDKMTGRPQSHEITFLVPLLIRASNFLNMKLDLVKHDQGRAKGVGLSRWLLSRVNLRFLADYRNIVFICLVSWVWQLCRSWRQ